MSRTVRPRFCGYATHDGRIGLVTVNYGDARGEMPLPPSQLAKRIAPGGYGWGYTGSGVTGLASAILTAVYGDTAGRDRNVCQQFAADVLARCGADWTLDTIDIDTWRS